MTKSYPDTGHGGDGGPDQQLMLVLPRLSDQAVIEIQDFLHQALERFEDHYGEQIDRFYQSLNEESQDDALDLGDWPL